MANRSRKPDEVRSRPPTMVTSFAVDSRHFQALDEAGDNRPHELVGARLSIDGRWTMALAHSRRLLPLVDGGELRRILTRASISRHSFGSSDQRTGLLGKTKRFWKKAAEALNRVKCGSAGCSQLGVPAFLHWSRLQGQTTAHCALRTGQCKAVRSFI